MAEDCPPEMERLENFGLPYYDIDAYGRMSLQLFKADAMYWHHTAHYLSVGASALNVVRGAQSLAAVADFTSILDFGSGAGRVTRWLRAAYPHASITAADIREEDLRFCSETFDAATWISGTDIDAMEAPGRYDLIWVGSVLTHLSASKTLTLLEKMLGWLLVNGVAVLSFHGRSAYSWRNGANYGPAEMLPKIDEEYEKTGFGYSDYPNSPGYGISFCTPSWIIAAVEKLPGCRLVTVSELAWDRHHDIVAIQRIDW